MNYARIFEQKLPRKVVLPAPFGPAMTMQTGVLRDGLLIAIAILNGPGSGSKAKRRE